MVKTKSKKQNVKKLNTKGFKAINYPVGDFLIRLKNASLGNLKEFSVPSTSLVKAVAKTLEKQGYIEAVDYSESQIHLKVVYRKKEPVLTNIRLISKPGLRIYMGADDLEKIKSPAIFIVSTPKGVMSHREATRKRLGGEVIAEIL